ncbi:MAG: SCP2 sterol-binding domain-containing protein [Sulfolobales archaeon]
MVTLDLMRRTAEITNNDPKLRGQLKGPMYFQFEIEGEPPFYMEITPEGVIRIVEGRHSSPTAVLSAKDEVMVKIIKGELDPVRAYLRGELKIRGDIFASQRIGSLLSQLRGRI